MTDAIRHRGPDASGHWADGDAGICLGHRRLSIIDVSPTGAQPMESPAGRYVVAFNGEIYNFKSLRDELIATGVCFRGTSDTEVMLAAFDRWGVAPAVRRFHGQFAFALWDRDERSLYLCRDRFGEKPLYYGWLQGQLVFGSELKALKAHPAWSGEIDRGALALFMRHNCVPAPYSIYRGIHKLPPATILRVAPDGQVEREEYWSAADVAAWGAAHRFEGSASEIVDGLDLLLRQTVSAQMVSDVPLGAFLSGGIDSSTIVALMQAESTDPVRTFTIGFDVPGFNEAEHARAVAAHLGTKHTELYVTASEARDVIPLLPSLFDEPFADSSQIPTYLVASLARRDVTVSLSGDGGDELFAGYNRYAWTDRVWRGTRRVPPRARSALATMATAVRPGTWDRVARMARSITPSRFRFGAPGDKIQRVAQVLRSTSPQSAYRELLSHWPSPTDLVLGATEPPTLVSGQAPWHSDQDIVASMMYLDAVSYLPDDILMKVDRATMAVSLESRAPFLDHSVYEFATRVPAEMLLRKGQGKWLLRELLARYVPRALFERPKMGFGVPLGSWLRGPLRQWAGDLLSPARLEREGYLNSDLVQRTLAEHLSGSRNRQHLLWDVLMFEAWLEREGSMANV